MSPLLATFPAFTKGGRRAGGEPAPTWSAAGETALAGAGTGLLGAPSPASSITGPAIAMA